MDFTLKLDNQYFQSWGCGDGNTTYLLVYDKKTNEYTASTKTGPDGKTIYIVDYGTGVTSRKKAQNAILKFHKKGLHS